MVIKVPKKESQEAGMESTISLEWSSVGREAETLSLPLSWPRDLANRALSMELHFLPLASTNRGIGDNKSRHLSGAYMCQVLYFFFSFDF